MEFIKTRFSLDKKEKENSTGNCHRKSHYIDNGKYLIFPKAAKCYKQVIFNHKILLLPNMQSSCPVLYVKQASFSVLVHVYETGLFTGGHFLIQAVTLPASSFRSNLLFKKPNNEFDCLVN
jgi:hypothetical protein